MNVLKELMADIAQTPQDFYQQSFLRLLQEEEQKIGEHPSEEETEEAVRRCIAAHNLLTQGTSSDEGNGIGQEEQQFLAETMKTIRDYLDSKYIHYRIDNSRTNLTAFYFGVRVVNGTESCTLRLAVMAGTAPRTCCVEAVLPLTVNKAYEYLLCQAICRENYYRRYGALQYQDQPYRPYGLLRYKEEDHTLAYRYSFPIERGLCPNELQKIISAVVYSANDGYRAVKKHCEGSYDYQEIRDILQKTEQLLDALNQS